MIGYSARKSIQWCVVVVMFLLLSGCLGRSSPKVTYYSLMTMGQLGDAAVLATLPEVRLGVGPITIPDSLKRSQLATLQRDNQYEFSEFNRWAGVLEQDITSVLGDNLGQLLGIEKVGFFPWMHYFKPTYRVTVDIQRMEGLLDGEAELGARWAIADAGGKEFLAGGKFVMRQPLEKASYTALVKAQSQLLAELSKKIAGEIDKLITAQ